MGEAPKPRDMRSTFGKSLGVAVQGIMPEIVRNKAHPDAADRTGIPWPAASDALMVVRADDDSTLSGTSGSFEMAFSLPEEGLWLITCTARVAGYADTSDAHPVHLEATLASTAPGEGVIAFTDTQLPLNDYGPGAWNVSVRCVLPITTIHGIYRIGYVGLDLTLQLLYSGTADFDDVRVDLNAWAVRLSDAP